MQEQPLGLVHLGEFAVQGEVAIGLVADDGQLAFGALHPQLAQKGCVVITKIVVVRVHTVDGVEKWAANVCRSFLGYAWVREISPKGWRDKEDALTRAQSYKSHSNWKGDIEINS